jgi:hypothetical protein
MAKRSNISGAPGWNWEAKAWLALWLLVLGSGVIAYFRPTDPTLSPLASALLVIGVLSSVLAIFWIPWFINRRRTNALASAANDLAMEFIANPSSEDLGASSKLSVFQLGSAGSLRNLMIGKFGRADVQLVDYYCRAGPGRDRAYRSKTTVVIFPNAAAGFPDFMLIPRVGLTRGSVMNLALKSQPDLKIGKQPAHAFASHYWVSGTDREALRNLFSPRVMDFFEANKNWNVEMLDGQMAIYKMDRLVQVKDYTKRLEVALLVLKAFTRS